MSELVQHQQIDQLYKKNHSWLQGWLRAKLNCSHQAADFAQDTFVRLLCGKNSLNNLSDIREPKSYLTTIANRVMVDSFRRNALEKSYIEALKHQDEHCEISAEQRLIIMESLQALDTMLYGLGEKTRRAFLLSQLQGMPYADIALDLQVSVSSVKKYMAKATTQCLLFALDLNS
jgi:RNA polymerase sigma-70 factor (ECF subfamily)